MFTQVMDFFSNSKPWLVPLVQFIGLLLFTFVLNRNYIRVSTFLSTRSLTIYLVIRAFYLPLLALIYLSCLKLLIPYFTKYAPLTLTHVDFDKIYQVMVLAIFIWFVGRFTSMVKAYILRSDLMEGPLNERMIYFVFELFYWTLILIFVLGSLHMLQIEISDTVHTLGKGIIIWSFTLIFLYTVYVGVNENIKIFSEKGEFLASVFFRAISAPLLLIVFGTGMIFFISMTSLRDYFDFSISFKDIFVPCFFWAMFRTSILVEEEFLLGRLTRHYPDKTRVQAIGKLTRLLTLLFAILFLFADRIQYATKVLTYIGASSAFIVGIAAQTIIGNYLSGFIMHFEGNFSVGDWIYSTDKNIEGVVEYMGMRTTTLRTLDKRVLYIPNSFFSTANIVNATKMTNRRIDEVIPVERVKPEVLQKVTEEVRIMLQEHPEVDQYLSTMAHLTEFGPASLNLSIRAFTKKKDLKSYRTIRQDVFLKVMDIIEKHGAALAPTNILPKGELAKIIKAKK